MRIERITTKLETIAAAKPTGRVSLTDTARKPTPSSPLSQLTVSLHCDKDIVGVSSTILQHRGSNQINSLIESDLSELLIGDDPRRHDALFTKVTQAFDATGFTGLIARAYASIDLAMWDAKAKSLDQPLSDLLGSFRKDAPFFVSDNGGPHRSIDDVIRLAKPWIKKGAKGVVVEVGTGDVQADADRVRTVSDEFGEECWIGVNANGRYDLGTAVALAHFFDDIGVGWFEEPLPIADSDGYRKLADRMETTLAAGSRCQSLTELIAFAKNGSVRVLRPDPLRLGGLTPILKLAAVAEACHTTIVPVKCASIGEQLCLGLNVVPQYERNHESIEA